MPGLMSFLFMQLQLVMAQADTEALDQDNPVWEGWGSVIFIMGILLLVVIVVVAGLWFSRGIVISRVNEEQQRAYQRLAEHSSEIQQQLLDQQQRLMTELADARTRIASIERMLREVE